MNRRQGQPGDSIEACDEVVSTCRPVENREPEGVLLCEHIFYNPSFRQSIFSRQRKKQKGREKSPLQETERRVNKINRGKAKDNRGNSANIPSRNLIVHNLPDVGSDLPVSLVAIHLGHYTHLILNLSLDGSDWYKDKYG